MSARWYAVRAKPRSEFLAEAELDLAGIQVFCPRVKATQPRAGQPYTPLFPGYLFIRCKPEAQGWPSFRQAHRITGYVRFGDEIPSIPDDVIVRLKDYCETTIHDGGRWERFLAGETVHVTSDHFQGLAQVVENNTPNAQVVVLLAFMGRLVKAKIPGQNLRHVNTPATEVGGMRHQPMEKPTVRRRTRGGGRRTKEYKEYREGFGAST